jgi:hypothetical protein
VGDVADQNEPCALHELRNCAICYPPPKGYPRGRVAVAAPTGYYVQIHPGTGVYHHVDCGMVTGDWDGAEMAMLGKRIVRSPEQIRELGLRPAQCCEPPTI